MSFVSNTGADMTGGNAAHKAGYMRLSSGQALANLKAMQPYLSWATRGAQECFAFCDSAKMVFQFAETSAALDSSPWLLNFMGAHAIASKLEVVHTGMEKTATEWSVHLEGLQKAWQRLQSVMLHRRK